MNHTVLDALSGIGEDLILEAQPQRVRFHFQIRRIVPRAAAAAACVALVFALLPGRPVTGDVPKAEGSNQAGMNHAEENCTLTDPTETEETIP